MALTMDRASKKRRFNLNLNLNLSDDNNMDIDNDIDNDDVKMDKFFALIRSAKDIRDQLLGIEAPRIVEKCVVGAKPTTTKVDELKAAVWMPSFQPEDFGEIVGSSKRSQDGCSNKDADHSIINITNNININNNVNGNVNGNGGGFLLDLNLSL
ncbi:hypothetical protein RND81_09G242500 [Saponaria officinalis]|uniref:Uncharacterized protein n=1 Tax=Saponaria officinalis TaxID=3572 RepID=A0AAW1IRL1_SAPOF